MEKYFQVIAQPTNFMQTFKTDKVLDVSPSLHLLLKSYSKKTLEGEGVTCSVYYKIVLKGHKIQCIKSADIKEDSVYILPGSLHHDIVEPNFLMMIVGPININLLLFINY